MHANHSLGLARAHAKKKSTFYVQTRKECRNNEPVQRKYLLWGADVSQVKRCNVKIFFFTRIAKIGKTRIN
jgi:hypothetical protein